jgi:CubicO group peptidase (beta-lactamase class C family)
MSCKPKIASLLILFIAALQGSNAAASPEKAWEFASDNHARFDVPIPPNWNAQSGPGRVTLRSPNTELQIEILALQQSDIDRAVKMAWSEVEPDFSPKGARVADLPIPEGFESLRLFVYNMGNPRDFALASARVNGDHVYCILIHTKSRLFSRYQSIIGRIGEGLTVRAAEETPHLADGPADVSDRLGGSRTLVFAEPQQIELDAFINTAREEFEVVGASVAIIQDGKMIFSKGYGQRQLGNPLKTDANTLMMIASTTKPVTSLAIAKLVDEKILDWNSPIQTLMPELVISDPDLSGRIELRHLLCHCTGVAGNDIKLIFDTNGGSTETLLSSLADYPKVAALDSQFSYNNEAYSAAGYLAARKWAESANLPGPSKSADLHTIYMKMMSKVLFEPLGMSSTTFSADKARSSGNFAFPHNFDIDGSYHRTPLRFEQLQAVVAPSGALWSNANDMAKYLIAEMNEGTSGDGKQIVSVANTRHRWQEQIKINSSIGYGLGWMVTDYKGLTMLEHNGGSFGGFTSDMAFLPDVSLGVVVLTNQRQSLLGQAVRFFVFESLLQQPHKTFSELQQMDKSNRANLASLMEMVAPDPKAREDLAGRYNNPMLGDVVISDGDNGSLHFETGNYRNELLPMSEVDGQDEDEISFIFSSFPNVLGWVVTFNTGSENSYSMELAGHTFTRRSMDSW